jgi:hypothetical protein
MQHNFLFRLLSLLLFLLLLLLLQVRLLYALSVLRSFPLRSGRIPLSLDRVDRVCEAREAKDGKATREEGCCCSKPIPTSALSRSLSLLGSHMPRAWAPLSFLASRLFSLFLDILWSLLPHGVKRDPERARNSLRRGFFFFELAAVSPLPSRVREKLSNCSFSSLPPSRSALPFFAPDAQVVPRTPCEKRLAGNWKAFGAQQEGQRGVRTLRERKKSRAI